AVGDEGDTRHQPIEAVDEVDGVHDQHDSENRDDERDTRGKNRYATENRQRVDLNARGGEHPGGDDLPGELGEPVEIPDVVGNADEHDDEGADKHTNHLERLDEDQ